VVTFGVLYAILSGICNGLFTTPMKLIPGWKWENIWLVFIVTACLLMPSGMVLSSAGSHLDLLHEAPEGAVICALLFGFAWGFGAILFGLSVDHLGVSLANSLVIGLSSALGSAVPLFLRPTSVPGLQIAVLTVGILVFLLGVALCGSAGRLRESAANRSAQGTPVAYLFCLGSGILSAVFNIGYSLALPISDTGVRLGYSRFTATNWIWLLMLAAGSIPSILYCSWLMRRNRSAGLFRSSGSRTGWVFSVLMGLLWGGSIFLYGVATPLLGNLGPSIGWPLSLATGLLVANLMGVLLGEWRNADRKASRLMWQGISVLLAAILICAYSTKVGD
jgi:L-rhamnose-H+ transport protein